MKPATRSERSVQAVSSRGGRPVGRYLPGVEALFTYMKDFPDGSEVSIALLVADSTVFIGARRQNQSVICVENRTGIFEIGSVTKTVTATMLAKLAYDGVVDLDAPHREIGVLGGRQGAFLAHCCFSSAPPQLHPWLSYS